MEASPKVGLEALLTPDNCVLVLIDHQPFQLANVNSHEPTMVMNNVASLERHTIWPSVASWPRGLNRLRGLAWPENSSVIGRVLRGPRRSFSCFSTTPALPVPYSRGRCSCYRLSESRGAEELSCRKKHYDTESHDSTESPLSCQAR